MKKAIALLALLILQVLVVHGAVRTVTLPQGDSFLFDGKNITLVDSTEDAVSLCINGERVIIQEDAEKSIGLVQVKVKDSTDERAELTVSFDCKETTDDDCNCDGNECANVFCFLGKIEPLLEIDGMTEELTTSTESEIIAEEEIDEETTSEEAVVEEVNAFTQEQSEILFLLPKWIASGLASIAIILGLIVWHRNKFK